MPAMALLLSRPARRADFPMPAIARVPARAALSHVAAALLLAALTHTAQADGATPAGSGLRFNGFGTVGLAEELPGSDWGLRREVNTPEHHDHGLRADVDSRLGLQASWSPAPSWELVGQLVLKPRAQTARAEESLAWAFVAWHPTPAWTVRVGRTSPDLFLLADYRNVGFAYPWVRPNVEFYGWMPVSNTDGIDVARAWQSGDTLWRAKLFSGRADSTMASTHDDGDTYVVLDSLNGGTLSAQHGGFTLKATVAEARTRAPNSIDSLMQMHDGLDALAALQVPGVSSEAAALRDTFPTGHFVTRYAALSSSWDVDAWRWQAEVARINGNFLPSNALYGYVSGAYRRGDATFFAMAGRAKTRPAPLAEPQWQAALTPLVGPQAAAMAQSAGSAVVYNTNVALENQSSLSIGLRWDFSAQMAWKLQVDDVHVGAQGGGLWAYSTPDAHHAQIVSSTLDFVF
jgi:hypothetical protein